LLRDGPELAYAFWGAIKIGAVPVPTNTLLKPRDYEYMLNDSRAAAAIVSDELAPAVEEIRSGLKYLKHLVVAGAAGPGQLALGDLLAGEPDALTPAETTRDDVVFWPYTSGPRPCSTPAARSRRKCSRSSPASGPRCSSRSPPRTRPCYRCPTPNARTTCVRCGCASRRGSPCRR